MLDVLLSSFSDLILLTYLGYMALNLTALDDQVTASVTTMAMAVSRLQQDVVALAAASQEDPAQLNAIITRLKDGTDNLAAQLARM